MKACMKCKGEIKSKNPKTEFCPKCRASATQDPGKGMPKDCFEEMRMNVEIGMYPAAWGE